MAKIRTPAVAYLRTSSAANVGTDLGSERRQRVAIPAFAERAGFEIADDDWYYDAAGSGAASDRGPRRLRQAAMPHRLLSAIFSVREDVTWEEEAAMGLPSHGYYWQHECSFPVPVLRTTCTVINPIG